MREQASVPLRRLWSREGIGAAQVDGDVLWPDAKGGEGGGERRREGRCVQARGDGLGFEFNRCDFKLGEQTKGAAAQPVQLATVTVDKKPTPQWGFYVQPLDADHWISTARGPPADIVDAHGAFTKTFAETRVDAAAVAEQLALAEPPFATKTIDDLVPDDKRDALVKSR